MVRNPTRQSKTYIIRAACLYCVCGLLLVLQVEVWMQTTCHVRLLFWKLCPCWFSMEDCKQKNSYITGHLSWNGDCKSCCCAELVPSARLRFGSASSASLWYRSPSSASYPLSIPCITAGSRNRWQNNGFKGITLQLMASFRERASVI